MLIIGTHPNWTDYKRELNAAMEKNTLEVNSSIITQVTIKYPGAALQGAEPPSARSSDMDTDLEDASSYMDGIKLYTRSLAPCLLVWANFNES